MAASTRMEDSEFSQPVGSIKAEQSITDVALFFGFRHTVILQLWKQFKTSQKVVWRFVAGRPSVTSPIKDQYIAIVIKWNRRSTSSRLTSKVSAVIGKMISTTIVRRRPFMNDLYALVPPVCVPLSDKSRGHGKGEVTIMRIGRYLIGATLCLQMNPDLQSTAKFFEHLQ